MAQSTVSELGVAESIEIPSTEASQGPGMAELLQPVRSWLVAAVAAQVVASLAGIVPYIAVAELARVLLASGPVDADRAWMVAAVGAGALLVRLTFLMLAGGLSHYADNHFQLSVRQRVVDRLGRVPLGWFADRSSGEIKKAVQDDVDAMHHLVAHSLLNLAASIVVPLVSLAYLFWVDWRMALVTLIPVVIGIGLYVRLMSGYGAKLQAYEEAQQRINSSIVEFVQGIAVVKTFGQTTRAHRRFADAADDFARFFLGWVTGLHELSATSSLALSPVSILATVLGAGTLMVAYGWLPGVDLVPFAIVGLGFAAPLLTLEFSGNDLQVASLAAKRVGALLATPELPARAARQRPARSAVGQRVSFAGVHFSYDGEHEVLSGIDLDLEPGTVTALVGPSGSGKSTLAKLLPRFFDVTAGAIFIGDVDVRDIPLEDLYRRVSFVLQDVQLLNATVADNIRLANPDADIETVRRAARAAAIDERIVRLPRGYDSVVGVDARLSGGEEQRVSIARALLADAPIVVLDEATAFADPESEALIQDALSALAVGRTLLVIAHRLYSIVRADRIVVLEQGRIVERGTHGELTAAGGRYARMWAAQEESLHWSPRKRPPVAPLTLARRAVR